MHSSCSSLALNEHDSTTRLAQKTLSAREKWQKVCQLLDSVRCSAKLLLRWPAQCKNSYEHGKPIALQKDSAACLNFVLFTGLLGAGRYELLRNFFHTRDDEHFHHIFIRRRIKARKISRHVIGSFVSSTSQLHVAWHGQNFQCFATAVLVWVHTRRW